MLNGIVLHVRIMIVAFARATSLRTRYYHALRRPSLSTSIFTGSRDTCAVPESASALNFVHIMAESNASTHSSAAEARSHSYVAYCGVDAAAGKAQEGLDAANRLLLDAYGSRSGGAAASTASVAMSRHPCP